MCRAGLKLEAALDHWGIDVTGKAALDSGLSTGGFTDCLLQRGAASVVGVDVGYGQVGKEEGKGDEREKVRKEKGVPMGTDVGYGQVGTTEGKGGKKWYAHGHGRGLRPGGHLPSARALPWPPGCTQACRAKAGARESVRRQRCISRFAWTGGQPGALALFAP